MNRNEYGYKIEVLINGTPLDELTVERTHDAGVADKTTLNITGKVILKKDDVISFRLTSLANADSKKGSYSTYQRISLERVPVW